MNILITGVAGLIGSRLADWLLENASNVKVIGIDDLSGGYKENLDDRVIFYQKNLHKVLLEPGEMIFYESATLKHGRPEPLSGEYYSNIFCHYMPKMVS